MSNLKTFALMPSQMGPFIDEVDIDNDNAIKNFQCECELDREKSESGEIENNQALP